MSRSKRKTPIAGNGSASSEKKDKRFANRSLRKIVKQKLLLGVEDDLLPLVKEISDPWIMSKDGKSWLGFSDFKKKSWYKKMMRK
jgi:hypothetical protein